MAKARSTGKGGTAKAKQAAAVDAAGAAYETLDVGVRNAVAIVVLNRPAVHNAFNETLIAELTAVLRALDGDSAVRAVVLAGAGESFCAGADLNWMKKMAGFSRAQNLADAHALAAMLATLDTLTKPTIARTSGSLSMARSAAVSSAISVSLNALCTSGRLSTTIATALRTATSIVS